MAVGNGIPYLGWQSLISVAKQVTSSTFVTGAASSFMEFNSESMTHEIEEIKIASIRNSRDYHRKIQGNETVSGSIDYDLNLACDPCIWIIKQGMGGACSSAAISAGISYNHDINTGDMESTGASAGSTPIQSLSIAVRKGSTDAFEYATCRVNSFTIKGEVGQPVVVTAEIVGQSCTINDSIGSATPAFTTVRPVYFKDVRIYTGVSIGAASTEEFFTGFEFTVNNNIDTGQRSLGSKGVTQLPVGMRDVSLKLTARYDTLTSYNRFLGDTMTAVKIAMVTDVTVGVSNNQFYTMNINIPNGRYKAAPLTVGDPGVLNYDVELVGYYGASAASSVWIDVINGSASYD